MRDPVEPVAGPTAPRGDPGAYVDTQTRPQREVAGSLRLLGRGDDRSPRDDLQRVDRKDAVGRGLDLHLAAPGRKVDRVSDPRAVDREADERSSAQEGAARPDRGGPGLVAELLVLRDVRVR